LWEGILLLTAFLLCLSPAYGAGTITENFANNQYNTQLWYLYNSGPGTTAQVANERLEVDVAGSGYSGLIASGFSLIGDFDVQVDFTLINWPTNNGAQLAIGMQPTQSESYLCMLGRANSNGNEQYFTIFLIILKIMQSSDRPGAASCA
jgi:hypothetical protein